MGDIIGPIWDNIESFPLIINEVPMWLMMSFIHTNS